MNKIVRLLDEIIPIHKQIYDMSCGASLMEVVSKHEDLMDVDDYSYQSYYKEENIGFDELSEIRGLAFSKLELTAKELKALVVKESLEERIVLFSIFQGFNTPFTPLSDNPERDRSLSMPHMVFGTHIDENFNFLSPRLQTNEREADAYSIDIEALYSECTDILPQYKFDCRTYVVES